MVGVDPGPLTPRRLVRMAVARQRAAWDRTAALMAWVAAKWCGERVDPLALNPYRRKAQEPAAEEWPEEVRKKVAVEVWKSVRRQGGFGG